MELKERERYVFFIICTFSGEMGYRDLVERERERRGTPVARKGEIPVYLGCV